MQRRAKLVYLALLLLAAATGGCTEEDPLYCDAVTPCPAGQVCDAARRECVTLADGGTEAGALEAGAGEAGALEAGASEAGPDGSAADSGGTVEAGATEAGGGG